LNAQAFALLYGVNWYRLFMPEVASFTMKYDGSALEDHTIDINDLAPALLAINDLILEANRIANQDRSEVKLRVKAQEPGCFQVDIQVIQSVWAQAKELLTGADVTAVVNLLTMLGLSGVGGVMAVSKFLKGRNPKAVEEKSPTTIQITNIDNRTMIVEKTEFNIFQSPVVKKAFYQIAKPTEKEGVDKVVFIDERNNTSEITKADVPYFNPDTLEEEIQESTREVYVNVEHAWLSGDEARKWKFKEGSDGASWNANISDQEFLKKIIKGDIALSGADTLKVRVKQTQYKTGTGIKSEYEILQVIEHVKGFSQVPLDFSDPSSTLDKP